MKIKHLIIVSLILAILTIGAVSASDDADNLAVSDDIEGGGLASSVDDVDVIAGDGDDPGDGPEDTRSEVDKSVNIPEEARTDDEYSSIDINVYEEDITGNVTVKIINDDETETPIYNEEIIPAKNGYWDYEEDTWVDSTGGNHLILKDLNLKPGTYNLEVSYAGDENYQPFTVYGTLNYYFMDVDVEDEIIGGFYISMASDATGTIEVFIDGELYRTIDVQDALEEGGDSLYVRLNDLSYSNHTYKIAYKDDEKYELDEPFEGEFNLTYRFYVYDEFSGDIEVGDEVPFIINYPWDANGEVVITYNGKTITKKIVADEDDEEGELWVYLSDFNVGENNITFTYKDTKYPEKSVIQTVYVNPKFDVPYQMRYANEEDAISIALSADAKGNLVISKRGEWNDTLEDYEYEVIANVSLVNGKANYAVTSLGLGDHVLKAVYDGDDYSEYFDDEDNTHWIHIVPDVIYDTHIYANGTNSIKVVLPDNVNDNLTVTIRSYGGYWDDELEEYVYNYENETYNAAANGTVTVQLPKLEVGEYYIYVKYGDDYSDSFWINVRGTAPEFEFNVTFPSEIMSDNREIPVNGVPDDANGYFELYIDGSLYRNFWIYEESNSFYLYYDELGTHTWEIRYVGDSYYKAAPKSGTFLIDWVEVHAQMYTNEEIDVDLDGKEGYVTLKIDGKSYTKSLYEGYASIPLKDVSVGTHTYELSYYDKNNQKLLTKTGSLNVTYYLGTSIDEEQEYFLTKEFKLYVDVPEDATGTVTVKVDGKTYTAKPVNGTATVILKDLVIGQNNVTVSYAGDSKYPAREIKEVINIAGYGITVKYVGSDEEMGMFESVSILLPADANGTLNIYKGHYVDDYEYWDDEGGDWIWVDGYWEIDDDTPIMSVKLENGYAIINASQFTYGVYDLVARYVSALDEPDYEVDDVDVHFDIVPDVNFTYEILLGENATVSIIIPDAAGVVNIYKYVETINEGEEDEEDIWTLFATIESDNGTFKKALSGLDLGEHSFYLEYDGEDMENFFNSHAVYIIYVSMAKNVTFPEEFNSDGSGVITFELPEGASGNISVYEDISTGEEAKLVPIMENVTYTSANKTISISGLSKGRHYISIVYVDDKNGNETFEGVAYVPAPKGDEGIIIPNEISGDSLDIKLPKDATGGVLVTVDGEGTFIPLKDGVAKVDLSKLADGPHTITVQYDGDGNYSGFEKSANVTVKKPVDPKITAANLNVLYTAGTKYTVTVYGTDGKVAPNTKVTFLVNGKVFGTATTDAKGIASIKITQKPGTYKITTKALGKEVTKTLKVKHIVKLQKVKVKRSAKKLVIKATLAKVNKKYLKGKKITLKFNGKKFTAKTDKKGVAKFTIKSKVLKKLKAGKKVTYQATYLKDTVKRTVKVKK